MLSLEDASLRYVLWQPAVCEAVTYSHPCCGSYVRSRLRIYTVAFSLLHPAAHDISSTSPQAQGRARGLPEVAPFLTLHDSCKAANMPLFARCVVVLSLFLQFVVALPRDETAASSRSVIAGPGGHTFTVPPGYTPSPAVPPPKYMIDNQHNYFHAAPDRYNSSLVKTRPSPKLRASSLANRGAVGGFLGERQSSGSSYWLANMGHGSVRALPLSLLRLRSDTLC